MGEAIFPWVIRRDIETFYVKDDPEFDKVGNIAALLRYRSENKSSRFRPPLQINWPKPAAPIPAACAASPAE